MSISVEAHTDYPNRPILFSARLHQQATGASMYFYPIASATPGWS